MLKVFISHPLSNDLKTNRHKVDKICRNFLSKNILPISPAHLFGFIDEETPELREYILETCCKLIHLADVVIIFGDSEGCKIEEAYARKIGKPVYFIDKCKGRN